MGCAIAMVKCFLFIFNMIFAVSGAALMGVGIYYKVMMADMSGLTERVDVAPMLLIIVGAVVFIIAFFGCCGAIRENHCMVVTYATLLLIIFVIEVGLGIYIYLQSNGKDIDKTISTEFSKVFDKYGNDEMATKTVDSVQQLVHCCGKSGPSDYVSLVNLIFRDGQLPKSCCKEDAPNNQCTVSDNKHFDVGCVQLLDEYLDFAATFIGILAMSIAGIEIIGIIFALCLANSIKNENRRMGV